MGKTKKTTFLAAVLVIVISQIISAEERNTYKGMGRSSGTEHTMSLANGETVVWATSEGVATISTDTPALLNTKCVSLGLIDTKNKYSSDFYCTMRENNKDSFDLKGKEFSKEGTFQIIGGSGKWKGATGSGKFKLVTYDEHAGAYTFEMTVTTP